jgi:hypothetical protein
MSKKAGSHPLGKPREASDPGLERCAIKVQIHPHWFGIGALILPTCLPIFGSRLHLASSKGRVRKMEVTRVTSSQFRRKTVHKFLSGRGKSESKRVSKLLSVSHFQAGLLPNKRDGTSEMALRSPSMWMGVRGHALCSFRRKANAWIKFSATLERLDLRRATQLIEGELSPNSTIRFSVSKPQIPSMSSHSIWRPAISKSELVMFPAGLSNEIFWVWMSSGHCHRNTVGTHPESYPTTTPPTP